jgi:hypothetical protein
VNTSEQENDSTAILSAEKPIVEADGSTIKKAGRPTKYQPETVKPLLAAMADGLNMKQACLAAGISEATLGRWREEHAELEPRLLEARETARRKALAGIRAAGEAGDWRALEAFLRMSFPADYRRDANINVTATASAQQVAGVVCIEEQRRKLIELRQRLLSQAPMGLSDQKKADEPGLG